MFNSNPYYYNASDQSTISISNHTKPMKQLFINGCTWYSRDDCPRALFTVQNLATPRGIAIGFAMRWKCPPSF